jgi:glycosyltransferase involved in cell wall biosynthesis
MRFSLIVPTVNRVGELRRLLVSLTEQTHTDFEVILVDQNTDDRLLQLVHHFSSTLPLAHIRSDSLGAARARNRGVEVATGEVFAFPDDDCWYPPSLLSRADDYLRREFGLSAISGRALDSNGKPSVTRWDKRGGPIRKKNVTRRCCEFTLFVRKDAFAEIGGFDPTLGVGAGTPWGGHEVDDFVVRGLSLGLTFEYQPALTIYHENPVEIYDDENIRRAASYSRGMGYVMGKHRYSIGSILYVCLRPLAGMTLALAAGKQSKASYYWASFVGRALGWRAGIRARSTAGEVNSYSPKTNGPSRR